LPGQFHDDGSAAGRPIGPDLDLRRAAATIDDVSDLPSRDRHVPFESVCRQSYSRGPASAARQMKPFFARNRLDRTEEIAIVVEHG
jgi:hypothetical protein